MKSNTLTIASVLLFLVGAWAAIEGVWALFLSTGYLETWMQMYGATDSYTAFMIHMNQINGLHTLGLGLFFCILSWIPYRKAERWAWYTMLVVGGILMLGMLILWTPHAPFTVIFILFWIVGLVLPYKQMMGKSS